MIFEEGSVCFGAGYDSNCFLSCRARAIRYRQRNREAVGGFFSQIGDLYMVHHLWGMTEHKHVQVYIISPVTDLFFLFNIVS